MAARHNEQVLHKPCFFIPPFPSHHHKDHVIIYLDPEWAGDVLVLAHVSFRNMRSKVDTWLFIVIVDDQSPRVERDPCKGVNCLWMESKLQGNI